MTKEELELYTPQERKHYLKELARAEQERAEEHQTLEHYECLSILKIGATRFAHYKSKYFPHIRRLTKAQCFKLQKLIESES